MKWLISLMQIMFFGVIVCFAGSAAKSNAENYNANNLINRIEGIVWGQNRQPVSDIYVELQNENYSSISRMRTTTGGRFSFTVSRQGRYYVKVLGSGTNYLDALEPVEIVNLTRYSSDSVYLDIYLKFDKRKINVGITGITDSVFVQEVPEEARQLYQNAVKDINNKNNKSLEEIERALKIFPDYYDALNALGNEYVRRTEYQKSLPYLIKSIDVNQRSFSSFYALAYACYQLNHKSEALEAARAATILQPNSLNAQLLHGTVLRLSNNNEKAEKALLQAKNLSKDRPVAQVYFQLGLLYKQVGRTKDAIEAFESYLKIQPDASNKKEIVNLVAELRKETK